MSGPQFAHIQTWSKKPNKAGQCIVQILGEATRDPEYSGHVESPAPPRVLVGDPSTFMAEHDAHVAARETVARMKDGTVRTKAIRKDRHTMASVVMSYPVPRAAIVTDEAKARLAAWERRNMEWLSSTFGDQVRVVMAHDDEEHPHIHAWLLPDDPGADATTLHPGKVAKKRVEAEEKAAGAEPRAAVKAGNRALKEAMTAWQDAYYAAVGAPEGLTRAGPKRRRLTRQQWKSEKSAAAAMAEAQWRAAMAGTQAAAVMADAMSEAEQIRAAAAADARASAAAFEALAREIEAGTIRRGPDGRLTAQDAAALQPGRPHIDVAIRATVTAQDAAAAVIRDAQASAKEMNRAALMARADAEQDKEAAAAARAEAVGLVASLKTMLGRVRSWLKRPDLPVAARDDARRLFQDAQRALPTEDPREESDGPSGP